MEDFNMPRYAIGFQSEVARVYNEASLVAGLSCGYFVSQTGADGRQALVNLVEAVQALLEKMRDQPT
jgi:hypothetical protein